MKRRFIVKPASHGCWRVADRRDGGYYALFDDRLRARSHANQKNKESRKRGAP